MTLNLGKHPCFVVLKWAVYTIDSRGESCVRSGNS